jgi:hypothetical protein
MTSALASRFDVKNYFCQFRASYASAPRLRQLATLAVSPLLPASIGTRIIGIELKLLF